MILLDALTRLGSPVDRVTYWVGIALVIVLLIAIVGQMTAWRCWTPEYGRTREEARAYAKAITVANLLLTLPTMVLLINRAETAGAPAFWPWVGLAVVVVHNATEWLGLNGRPTETSWLALALSFGYIFVIVHLG